jgi:hypothetical protein
MNRLLKTVDNFAVRSLLCIGLLLFTNLESPDQPLAASKSASQIYPVVDVRSQFLLGGWSRSGWMSQEKIAPALRGGEHYRLYSLNHKRGTATGGKPVVYMPEIDRDQKAVKVRPVPSGSEEVIAVGGTWNALPRVPRAQNVNLPTYREAVSKLLKQKGIADPRVRITQLYRVDLEGDGTEEVVLTASSQGKHIESRAVSGDYSLALVRKVVDGKVRTLILAEDVHPRVEGDKWEIPYLFTVSAILDLNGDGKMEVVVNWDYYEGQGVEAYEIKGGAAKKVLSGSFGV